MIRTDFFRPEIRIFDDIPVVTCQFFVFSQPLGSLKNCNVGNKQASLSRQSCQNASWFALNIYVERSKDNLYNRLDYFLLNRFRSGEHVLWWRSWSYTRWTMIFVCCDKVSRRIMICIRNLHDCCSPIINPPSEIVVYIVIVEWGVNDNIKSAFRNRNNWVLCESETEQNMTVR